MDLKKITFIGDIMCEPRLLKAARCAANKYDFSTVFSNVEPLLKEADYVIGNLETPLAGEKAKYVHSLFSFNAPDCFAEAAKNAGIGIMLTANNHCLDRGMVGLNRTINVLDNYRILHAGTFSSSENRGNTYFTMEGVKYAVISYTYGTNYSANKVSLSDEEKLQINLLRPQDESYYIIPRQNVKPGFIKRIRNKMFSLLPEEWRYWIRKMRGVTVNVAHTDDNLLVDTMKPYMDRLKADVADARKNADIVLFCPHTGGQFNPIPGEVSCYIFDQALKFGADAIIASHAHVVQKAEVRDGVPCFYSLGNFSMSPNSVYLIQDHLPDYGIAAHLYINNKKIVKTTFSILKIIEEKNSLTVYPIDELADRYTEKEKLISEASKIYTSVTGKTDKEFAIQREYLL